LAPSCIYLICPSHNDPKQGYYTSTGSWCCSRRGCDGINWYFSGRKNRFTQLSWLAAFSCKLFGQPEL